MMTANNRDKRKKTKKSGVFKKLLLKYLDQNCDQWGYVYGTIYKYINKNRRVHCLVDNVLLLDVPIFNPNGTQTKSGSAVSVGVNGFACPVISNRTIVTGRFNKPVIEHG